MGSQRRLARFAARVALTLGAAALALLAAETGFRLTGYGDPATSGDVHVQFVPSDPFVLDEFGGITLQRDFRCDQCWHRATDGALVHQVAIRTNTAGLRGGAIGREPTPGRPRILGLGDSVTFGQGVEDHETFLAVAEGELSRRGRAVEVLNAGVPKRDLAQQLRWLEKEGFRLRPSLVLQCFYVNDLQQTDLGPEVLEGGGPPAPADFSWARPSARWRRHSFLFNQLWLALQHRRAMAALRQVIPEAGDSSWTFLGQLEREWDAGRARTLFQDLRRGCERARARGAVVILPSYIPGPAESSRTILEGGAAAAQDAGLTVIRLDDVGAETPLPDQYVVAGDQHPGAAFHRALGEALAERLPDALLGPVPVR